MLLKDILKVIEPSQLLRVKNLISVKEQIFTGHKENKLLNHFKEFEVVSIFTSDKYLEIVIKWPVNRAIFLSNYISISSPLLAASSNF